MSNTPIRAIETEYAGCRFRSRLEARWAVFFDTLGIQWEYEAEGYETSAGRYLPDFWLPELGLWVEVKGKLSPRDMAKMMGAIPDLRQAEGSQLMAQLLLLGPVPIPGEAWCHARFDIMHDRTIFYTNTYWALFAGSYGPKAIGERVGFSPTIDWTSVDRDLIRGFADEWTESNYDNRLIGDMSVDDAYRAARSARFEFGERG